MINKNYSLIKFFTVLLLNAAMCLVTTETSAQTLDPVAVTSDPLTFSMQAPQFTANTPALPDFPILLPEQKFSPLDTLHMSAWERLWWGRRGIMRLAFKLDEQNPVNDLRQMAKVRRKMLSVHQMLGMVTVASMAVTVAGGFKAANGNSGGLHESSLPFTIGFIRPQLSWLWLHHPS